MAITNLDIMAELRDQRKSHELTRVLIEKHVAHCAERCRKVDRLAACIEGNGKPGVLLDVDRLKTRQSWLWAVCGTVAITVLTYIARAIYRAVPLP